jgi:hypothetical protein
MGPMRRKEVSYWPLIYKAQGTSSSLFGDGTSNLVEAAVGKKQVNLDLHVAEKTPIRAQELETKKAKCFHICFQWFALERFQFSLGEKGWKRFCFHICFQETRRRFLYT